MSREDTGLHLTAPLNPMSLLLVICGITAVLIGVSFQLERIATALESAAECEVAP